MARKKHKDNYINNKDFSAAVCDYVESYNAHKGPDKPIVPNYVALGFKQIAEGLSHKPNFIGYSYRDEMVMDAIENCLRAIRNYNIEAATRTGKPNAFAYFTQITWYAFLRRIADEKKQLQTIARKYTSQYRDVMRAKIVLLAADGFSNKDIGQRLDLPRQIVSKWRKRFFDRRLAGLQEKSRRGRPSVFSP